MKKNKTMRLASGLLVAVLLTTCAISGTFAKYVSTSTGSDSARVADWDIKLEGTTMSNTFTFDLFNTIMDSNGTSAETDIKTSETLIAPGTSGSFEINLKNESEVNAKYGIVYTVTNSENIPVKFSVDNGVTWTNTLSEVIADDVTTKLDMNATEDTIVKVQWKWDYEVDADDAAKATNDANDTAFGTADTLATITVAAQVTVTQIN